MIKGRIIGKESLQKKLIALSAEAQISNAKTMTQLLVEIDSDAKKSISGGSRGGKSYKRGKNMHVASAPGEFPKTDRGGLVAGFLFNVKKLPSKVVGILENKAPYAMAVEFKLKSQGGRPFMRPLYKKWKMIAEARFAISLKQTIQKVARG